jgi:hypothetical protein
MKGRGQGMARIVALLDRKRSAHSDLMLAIQNPLVFDGGGPIPTQEYSEHQTPLHL